MELKSSTLSILLNQQSVYNPPPQTAAASSKSSCSTHAVRSRGTCKSHPSTAPQNKRGNIPILSSSAGFWFVYKPLPPLLVLSFLTFNLCYFAFSCEVLRDDNDIFYCRGLSLALWKQRSQAHPEATAGLLCSETPRSRHHIKAHTAPRMFICLICF